MLEAAVVVLESTVPIVAAVGALKGVGALPTAVDAAVVVPGLRRPILLAGAVVLQVQPVAAVAARPPAAPPLAAAVAAAAPG